MGKLKELNVYDNNKIIMGIDETGIGSGIAHACVACVILPKETEEMKKEYLWRAIRDSKKIKKIEKLEELETYIKENAIYYDIYDVSLEDIESMNVYHAKVKGFRDVLPAEALKREAVLRIIRKYFKLYGFLPIETPTIEYEDLLKSDNDLIKERSPKECFNINSFKENKNKNNDIIFLSKEEEYELLKKSNLVKI